MAPRSPQRGCVARLGLSGVVLAAAALSSAALPLPPNNQPVIGVLAVPIGNECITAWQETRQFDAAAANQSGGDGGRGGRGGRGGGGGGRGGRGGGGGGGNDNDALGSCFHSLYVQWLESSGARVVPIPYDVPVDELDHLLASVNGVLFTGGEVELHNLTSPYMNTARRVLARSVTLAGGVAGAGATATHTVAGSTAAGAASAVGAAAPASAAASTAASVGKPAAASAVGIAAAAAAEPFPVWGTCMGFQTLVVLAAEDPAILTEGVFDSESLALPLQLTAAGRASRLWGGLRPHVQDVLENENVTCNLHHDGIFAAAFVSNAKVAAAYTLVSTNVDRKGQRFVSTLEHRTAPVFATQWHPERPQFQFSASAGESGGINHGPAAVEAMQAVANFFVAQARQSSQRFANQTELAVRLIYNDVPRGPLGDSYRAYVFPPQR